MQGFRISVRGIGRRAAKPLPLRLVLRGRSPPPPAGPAEIQPRRPEEAVIHMRVAMLEIVTLLLVGARLAGIGVVQAGRMLGVP